MSRGQSRLCVMVSIKDTKVARAVWVSRTVMFMCSRGLKDNNIARAGGEMSQGQSRLCAEVVSRTLTLQVLCGSQGH